MNLGSIPNQKDLTDAVAISAQHLNELQASAISTDVIEERRYKSISQMRELPVGFKGDQRKLTGLLIPVYGADGSVQTYQLKPDRPRIDERGRERKYERPAGSKNVLDVPNRVLPYLSDRSEPLWITEGSKKVDSAISNGLPVTIGLLGVWNWMSNGFPIPDWRRVALEDREVTIAFDSDVMRKESVREALDKLAEYLTSQGAIVSYCLMPDLPDGSKCGLDDWFAAGNTVQELKEHVLLELPDPHPEWDPPRPLFTTSSTPFPLEALPPILAKYVNAVSRSTQTPVDLAAVTALGTLSAATRGMVEIQGPTWVDPLILQVMAVAKPGSRKSEVIKTITGPITAWEKDRRTKDAKHVALWQSTEQILEGQLRKIEQKGTPNSPEHREAVLKLQEHRENRPALTRILIDDATPEAATSTMAEQGGAAAVIAAEGTFFSNISGRYNDSPNLDVLLKGHAGDAITVSRKGREAEEIERAALTVCVAVQPDVVHELGQAKGFQSRGGAARLLPAFVPYRLGEDDLDAPPLESEFKIGWDSIVQRILNAATERMDPNGSKWSLELDAKAAARFREFREQQQAWLRDGGFLSNIPEWGSKMHGAVLRLAGALHVAQHDLGTKLEISLETMGMAIKLACYFMDHALVLHRFIEGNASELRAAEVLAAARDLGPSFTKRELHRKLMGRIRFERSDSLNKPLEVLEAKGWLRQLPTRRGRVGRKSELFEMNPLVLEQPDDTDEMPATVGSVNNVGVTKTLEGQNDHSLGPYRGLVAPHLTQVPIGA